MRKCADWIKSYCHYTAGLEAPDICHFWTAVSTIAGALRRRVWIDQTYFHWVANFYIILVGPPGIIQKTTTIGIGKRMLQHVPGVVFGPNAITWQALVQSLAEAHEAFQLPTGEFMSQSAITCSAGELGTLLDPHDRVQMDVLTDLWDGRAEHWSKVTKGSGSDVIENPWLNIISATTPTWLAENFQESSVGGGFASRCVFVYADRKRHLIAFPRQQTPAAVQQLHDDLVEDLIQIGSLAGEVALDASAISWGTKWYEQHYKRYGSILPSDRLIGYIARKQTHMMKIAIVVAAAQRDDLTLTAADLETAAIIADSIEESFANVFSYIGQTDAGKLLQTLLDALRAAGGKAERQQLIRALIRIMDTKQFDTTLTTAIHAGLVRQVQHGSQILVYLVHHA